MLDIKDLDRGAGEKGAVRPVEQPGREKQGPRGSGAGPQGICLLTRGEGTGEADWNPGRPDWEDARRQPEGFQPD